MNEKGIPIRDADDEQDGAKGVDVEREEEEEEERVVRYAAELNPIENRANPALLYIQEGSREYVHVTTVAGAVTQHQQKLFQGSVKITGFTNPRIRHGGMGLVVYGVYT